MPITEPHKNTLNTLQDDVKALEALFEQTRYQSFEATAKAWANKFNVVGFCYSELYYSEEFLNACQYLLRDAKELLIKSEAYLQAISTEQPENFKEIEKAYHEAVKSYELWVDRVVNNPALSAAVKRNIRNTCLSIAVFVLVAALIAATVATAVVLSAGTVLIPAVLGTAACLGAIANSLCSLSTLCDFNDLRRDWGGHSKAKRYHNLSLFGNSIKQTVAEALMERNLTPQSTTP